MQSIKDLINKIKWDKSENPTDFSLFYLDRISNKLKEIPYTKIKRVEDNFIVIEQEETGEEKEVQIPIHRIKVVKKKQVVVWRRKF